MSALVAGCFVFIHLFADVFMYLSVDCVFAYVVVSCELFTKLFSYLQYLQTWTLRAALEAGEEGQDPKP